MFTPIRAPRQVNSRTINLDFYSVKLKMADKAPSKLVRRMTNRSVFLVSIGLSAIGLVIQVFFIIYDYSRYFVIYDQRLEFPFELIIPDIIVCSRFMYILNYDLLLTEHGNLFKDLCHDEKSCHRNRIVHGEVKRRFFTSFNMDQADRYLFRSDDILASIQIGANETNELGNNCLAIDHLMFPESCFTVACRETGRPMKIIRGFNGVSFFHEILKVKLNVSVLKRDFNFKVIVHPPENSFSTPSDLGCSLKGNSEGLARFRLKYKRIFIERLPSPYQTNCRQFLAARELDECLVDYSLAKFGAPCAGRFIHPSKYLAKGYKFPTKDLCHSRDIHSTCFQPVQEECQTIRYLSSVQSEEFIDDNSERIMRVDILGPIEQDVVMFAYPKVTPFALLILISNVIIAWFGISVFNTIVTLILFGKDFCHKETKTHSMLKPERRRRFNDGLRHRPQGYKVRNNNEK